MSHTFSIDTTQLPVTSVCVYQADRAEVHRTLPVELEEGQNEIKIERLPSGVEPDSIRVEGTGSAVIFDVIHSPPPPVVLSYDKSQNPALHDLAKKKGNLNAEKTILEQQATVLKDYGSTLKAGVADAAKLAEFLELYKERKQQIFDELQKVKAQISEVDSEQDRIKKEFWADAAGQKRQTKVTVVVLAQQKGKAELSLRYMVNGASWTPMYDLRAKISHAPGESSSITLQYKASISQKTGEDWTDVALTLSTAAPQLGATIPTLTPYKIGRPRPPPPPPMAYMAQPMIMTMSAALPLPGVVEESEDDEDDDDDMGVDLFDEGPPPPAIAHATAQAIEGATSSTFVIAGKSTIPTHQQDDEQTHKVSVAVIDLDAKLEWVAVPKAQTSAFLKCKVKNTSQYILLPGQTSVFMDDNFVCKSNLPSVNPNESFSTSLGVDPAIRITYHPQQKKSKNATGGLLSSKIDVTAYVQRITIKNTRATAAAPLFIKDQIPVSEDSDLKVLLTEPRLSKERPEITIASGTKAHWAPRDADREDEDKTANAGTEEDGVIEWICDIPPGKTQELSLAWEVSGPAGKHWVRH
ncbi:hypothetical protein FRC04_005320 [Tulasnella sp. 424]|nr:hypothetical protein FRC04_005320 [Tulasnella sp. 424]KAG8976430.1 hypothetical protein FRC05_003673 [Tulasnella sp. 425]